MRKVVVLFIGMIFIVASASMCAQQDLGAATESNPHYYRLTLTVQEISDAGKVTNSRAYMTTIARGNSDQGLTQIRSGTRVPVRINDNGEITYLDIGVEADFKDVREVNGDLALDVTAVVSSLAPTSSANASPTPTVRENKWEANVVVPAGKPTIIFSADHLENKGSLQIELTATRLE